MPSKKTEATEQLFRPRNSPQWPSIASLPKYLVEELFNDAKRNPENFFIELELGYFQDIIINIIKFISYLHYELRNSYQISRTQIKSLRI